MAPPQSIKSALAAAHSVVDSVGDAGRSDRSFGRPTVANQVKQSFVPAATAALQALRRELSGLLLTKIDAIRVSMESFRASVFKETDRLNKRLSALESTAIDAKGEVTQDVVVLRRYVSTLLEGRASNSLEMDLRFTRVASRLATL